MDILDYTVIFVYLIGMLAMGVLLRKQSTKQDYFLGGRELGWKPLTLSIMATQLSAVSFISAPAFVGFREGGGLIWLSYELAVPLAMLLLLGTVLPTLYKSGVVSIYAFLENRFSVSTRLCISVVFQFSRAFSTGIMIYALSIILQGTMGITSWQAVLLIGVVTLLYSLQGGMKAVVYGDAVQMIIIILGTMVCAYVGMGQLGGFDRFLQLVPSDRLTAVNFSSMGFNGDSFGFFPMVLGGIILYASYYGCDQSEAQRALSAKNDKDLRKMMFANGILRFPITLLYCASGLIVGTLAFSDAEFFAQIPTDNPDWLMPIFILNYLPHGVIGLLVVAILAAAMSSLSSAINSLTAVSVEDLKRLYGRLNHRDSEEPNDLLRAKAIGIGWGIITLVLSLNAGAIAPTVIEAVNKVGSVFFGPVLAIFLLGMVSTKAQSLDVNIGLVVGVGTNVVLAFFVPSVFWFWWNVIGFSVASGMALLLSRRYKQVVKHSHSSPVRFHSVLTARTSLILIGYFISLVAVCWLLPRYLG